MNKNVRSKQENTSKEGHRNKKGRRGNQKRRNSKKSRRNKRADNGTSKPGDRRNNNVSKPFTPSASKNPWGKKKEDTVTKDISSQSSVDSDFSTQFQPPTQQPTIMQPLVQQQNVQPQGFVPQAHQFVPNQQIQYQQAQFVPGQPQFVQAGQMFQQPFYPMQMPQVQETQNSSQDNSIDPNAGEGQLEQMTSQFQDLSFEGKTTPPPGFEKKPEMKSLVAENSQIQQLQPQFVQQSVLYQNIPMTLTYQHMQNVTGQTQYSVPVGLTQPMKTLKQSNEEKDSLPSATKPPTTNMAPMVPNMQMVQMMVPNMQMQANQMQPVMMPNMQNLMNLNYQKQQLNAEQLSQQQLNAQQIPQQQLTQQIPQQLTQQQILTATQQFPQQFIIPGQNPQQIQNAAQNTAQFPNFNGQNLMMMNPMQMPFQMMVPFQPNPNQAPNQFTPQTPSQDIRTVEGPKNGLSLSAQPFSPKTQG